MAVLESFIDDFNGAIIFVSPDRFFADRLANKVFAYEADGNLRMYAGDYSYSKEKLAEEEALAAPVAESAVKKPKEKTAAAEKQEQPKRKFTFKEQKEYAEIEGIIASKEGELKVVQLQMAENATDFGRLNELAKEEARLTAEVEQLMERWEYLEEIAGQMDS
jgi:ATP-binding cassette subfamily F protein uup